jgi:hypothetical protein
MSGPNRKPRNAGERAEFLEKLAVRAALVVVVGLLVESGPDLARAIRKGVLPSREVQGNVLVTLAVAAEALLGWRALIAARKAEIEAEKRIAEANERAEQLRLARIRLEADLSHRRLTKEQAEEIVSKLSEFRGQEITLGNAPSSECFWFALELEVALNKAGWIVHRIRDPNSYSTSFDLRSTPDEETNKAATALNFAIALAARGGSLGYMTPDEDGPSLRLIITERPAPSTPPE